MGYEGVEAWLQAASLAWRTAPMLSVDCPAVSLSSARMRAICLRPMGNIDAVDESERLSVW